MMMCIYLTNTNYTVLDWHSRTPLIASILESSEKGASLTEIMYNSYMSHTQVQRFLTFLRSNGLLEFDDVRQLYKTTKKGEAFLEGYHKILKLLTDDMSKPFV